MYESTFHHEPMLRNQRQVTILQLWLQETGTYNPQVFRPFETVPSGSAVSSLVNRINDHIERTAGSTLTGKELAGISSMVLQPTATHQGEIVIPNGWNEKRMRFIMKVKISSPMGGDADYFIQGYTTHMGVSANGYIDPQMEFVMNSITKVNRLYRETAYGRQGFDKVNESNHLFSGSLMSQQNKEVVRMTPADVFSGIQANYLQNDYQGQLHDFRPSFYSAGFSASKRTFNIPTNYLASIADSYSSNLVRNFEFGQDQSHLLGDCQNDYNILNRSFSENEFIRRLSEYRGIAESVVFSYGNLLSMQPNMEDITKIIGLGPVEKRQLHHAGQSEYWHGSDLTTVMATTIINSTAALLMDLLINSLDFVCTNDDIGGHINTTILGSRSFTEEDYSANLEVFKSRFATEVMYDLTHGNEIGFNIRMSVDLFDQTVLFISIDGHSEVMFVAPSFCDSLTSNVLGTNRGTYHKLVNDMERIVTGITDLRGGRAALTQKGVNHNI